MYWIIFAIFSVFLIGFYNLSLEGIGKQIGKDYITKISLVMILLSITGINALACLFIIHFMYPNSSTKSYKLFEKSKVKVFVTSILIIFYMITNIIALAEGGGIAMSIINLNLFITLIGGAILYGDKIDLNIIVSLIISTIFVSYASYRSHLIQL